MRNEVAVCLVHISESRSLEQPPHLEKHAYFKSTPSSLPTLILLKVFAIYSHILKRKHWWYSGRESLPWNVSLKSSVYKVCPKGINRSVLGELIKPGCFPSRSLDLLWGAFVKKWVESAFSVNTTENDWVSWNLRTPNLRFPLKLKHKREPAASQRERVYTQDGRSHTRPLVSGAGAPPGSGMARVPASQDGLGEEEDWSRARRGGADEPAGWVCILSVLPACKASFLQPSGNDWGKRIKKSTHSLWELSKAVFSHPLEFIAILNHRRGWGGYALRKERRRSERTSSNASWIHKLIIAADMQILNSISSFLSVCLLFHLACCRIPY